MNTAVTLPEVGESDLATFFEQLLDPSANHLAAHAEPMDLDAFTARSKNAGSSFAAKSRGTPIRAAKKQKNLCSSCVTMLQPVEGRATHLPGSVDT